VVVVMMAMMTMVSRESGARKYKDEQNSSEDLLHGSTLALKLCEGAPVSREER
jgi:hypothetical protein